MKQKTRKLSIRTKILLPAIVLIVLLCVIMGINSYHQINTGMVAMGVEAVNIAMEESAKGVSNITEMSLDLTASVGDIENEANSNMDIAEQLNAEVNKFKLE